MDLSNSFDDKRATGCNVDLSKMMISSNHTNNNHSDISNVVTLSCVHDDGSIESIKSIRAPNSTISLLPN